MSQQSTSVSKEIVEGNKIIDNWVLTQDSEKIESKPDKYYLERVKYHTSWDWLMPVVKKIFDLARNKDLELGGVFLHKEAMSRYTPIGNECANVNIENVHFCVVKFIKWYNNQGNTAK